MKQLDSLTIFFPFLNDAGTVERQIQNAYTIGNKAAKQIEVIALIGGRSYDQTTAKIYEMQKKYPSLKIVNKEDNTEGYAVIKHGFAHATCDWVFYTDGDAQYHLEEDLLPLIEKQQKSNADVVNGYKEDRQDNIIRILLGYLYQVLSRAIFNLPIRDTDCDFRLIRRSFLVRIALQTTDSSILPELIVKLKKAGARFAEMKVHHYPREYGRSNYTPFALLREKIVGDFALFIKLQRE